MVINQAKIVQKLKNLPQTQGPQISGKSTTPHLPENRPKKSHSGCTCWLLFASILRVFSGSSVAKRGCDLETSSTTRDFRFSKPTYVTDIARPSIFSGKKSVYKWCEHNNSVHKVERLNIFLEMFSAYLRLTVSQLPLPLQVFHTKHLPILDPFPDLAVQYETGIVTRSDWNIELDNTYGKD